jgi:hypothetical protein
MGFSKSYFVGFIGSLFSSLTVIALILYLNSTGQLTDKHSMFGLIGWTMASEARTRGALKHLQEQDK